jgi:hypothetical protein
VVRAIRHACSPRITGTLNLHRTQTSCRPSSCSWEPSLVCGGRGGSAGLWRVEAIDWEFSCFFPPPKKFQSLAKQKRQANSLAPLGKRKGSVLYGKIVSVFGKYNHHFSLNLNQDTQVLATSSSSHSDVAPAPTGPRVRLRGGETPAERRAAPRVPTPGFDRGVSRLGGRGRASGV